MGQEAIDIKARATRGLDPPGAPEERWSPALGRLSVKDIYERVRDEEGFLGGYSTVSD